MPRSGLDKYFYDKARAQAKRWRSRRRIADRSLRQDVRVAAGANAAEHADRGRRTAQQRGGDDRGPGGVAMPRRSEDGAQLIRWLSHAYTSLIVERNNNWMPQIEACSGEPQPCLVVVGAAHLIGPDGLLTLQRKGLTGSSSNNCARGCSLPAPSVVDT